MPRKIQCECGEFFPVDPERLGRRVRCPSCRKSFVAEAEEESAADKSKSYELNEEPAQQPRSRKRPRKRMRKRPQAQGELMRRFQEQFGGLADFLRTPSVLFFLILFTLMALGSLGTGLTQFIRAKSFAAKATRKPLSKLIAEGAVDRPYVDLMDFFPGEHFVVRYVDDKGPFSKGNVVLRRVWTDIYVPLFPRTEQTGLPPLPGQPIGKNREPAEVVVLLHSTKIEDKGALERLATRSQLRGLAHYPDKQMNPQVIGMFQQYYPQTDASRIIILDKEKEPPTVASGFLWILGGGIGLLFCAFFLFVVYTC
jgi:hypothetical protein